MFADYGLPLPSHGLIASSSKLEKRPEAIRKFLVVSGRAWQQVWYGNGREAIDALLSQRPQAKLDGELELKRIAAYKPYAVSAAAEGKHVLWMPPADWEAAIKVMKDTAIIRTDAKATDFYTNAYLP
jgi:NitT/TauT family transport system substrate-binding protein